MKTFYYYGLGKIFSKEFSETLEASILSLLAPEEPCRFLVTKCYDADQRAYLQVIHRLKQRDNSGRFSLTFLGCLPQDKENFLSELRWNKNLQAPLAVPDEYLLSPELESENFHHTHRQVVRQAIGLCDHLLFYYCSILSASNVETQIPYIINRCRSGELELKDLFSVEELRHAYSCVRLLPEKKQQALLALDDRRTRKEMSRKLAEEEGITERGIYSRFCDARLQLRKILPVPK